MSDKADIAVGIDLGTTNSCVAAYFNGKVEIIVNSQGKRTTPSCVAFVKDKVIVGDEARYQARRNPDNTIFGVKRLIGKWYDDPTLKEDMESWPFTVINENNRPKMQCEVNGQPKILAPEDISAEVLKAMKKTAEDFLERKVTKAVVTVPANFDDNQKKKTKAACTLAGLEVLSMINEPTAAAIAYAIDKDVKSRGDTRTILVYDVGGGTLDVSILKVAKENFEVLATSGNSHLAGEDFENSLYKYLVKEFNDVYHEDISENSKAVGKLKRACQEAKEYLSFNPEANVEVDGLYKGHDFEMTIDRKKFEALNMELFERTITYVDGAIKQAKIEIDGVPQPLTIGQIDDVVLVGGSTRIPKLQSLLTTYFKGKEPKKGINPDEAVAHGAAIWAAHLNKSLIGVNLNLAEVTPLTLGVEITGGLMDAIIKANTRIPATASSEYTTVVGDQSSIALDIYQGERSLVVNNTLIGRVTMNDIPKGPPGVPQIMVTFEINPEGMLRATAHNKKTPDKVVELNIVREKIFQSRTAIEQSIAESQAHSKMDSEEKKRVQARNIFNSNCYRLKYFFASDVMAGKIPAADKEFCLKKIDECLSWIHKNSKTSLKAEFESRNTNLNTSLGKFTKKYANDLEIMFKKD